jgi:acyl-CoA synthetase (AMP-forming)/AMP-acid ligase II
MTTFTGFTLSTVFATVAATVPDNEMLVWRDRRLTYGRMDERINRLANVLAGAGHGLRAERAGLAGHQSGQDHLGLYLRNGNEYLEAMVAGYRARLAPFNVNYRYVDDELLYLLRDADVRALVYHAELADRVAALRDRLPGLRTLIQVADGSGNALLPGALDYEETLAAADPTPPDTEPSPDDLYILYTGGTTGMPKGVLWRNDDIYISAMGGRPFGSAEAHRSYDDVAAAARQGGGGVRILMIPPLMHGAAQWAAFNAITNGGAVVIPDDVHRLDAVATVALAARERVVSASVVGDAIARPLLEAIETGTYDLSGLAAVVNGGAPMTPVIKDRLLAALPHILVLDAVGSSETGIQMSHYSAAGQAATTGRFTAGADAVVVDEGLTRVLEPGEDHLGWLAQRGRVPLGYLGDADKTARTFPVIGGVRFSIPGDRARLLAGGEVELLGRDSVTINSGGEKVFAEEVERAVASHPLIADVIVVGRPSERWGSEVVAVVALAAGATVTDAELIEHCSRHIARYKLPKAVVVRPALVRSPAGKADYRWAREQALAAAPAITR